MGISGGVAHALEYVTEDDMSASSAPYSAARLLRLCKNFLPDSGAEKQEFGTAPWQTWPLGREEVLLGAFRFVRRNMLGGD